MYKAGQIWKITIGKYSDVKVHIHHVSNHDKVGLIIHISVPEYKLGHMPFAEEALNNSDVECLKDKSNLGVTWWEEGYNIWKTEWDKGKAGVYSVSISTAIDLMIDTITTGREV